MGPEPEPELELEFDPHWTTQNFYPPDSLLVKTIRSTTRTIVGSMIRRESNRSGRYDFIITVMTFTIIIRTVRYCHHCQVSASLYGDIGVNGRTQVAGYVLLHNYCCSVNGRGRENNGHPTIVIAKKS